MTRNNRTLKQLTSRQRNGTEEPNQANIREEENQRHEASKLPQRQADPQQAAGTPHLDWREIGESKRSEGRSKNGFAQSQEFPPVPLREAAKLQVDQQLTSIGWCSHVIELTRGLL